MACDEKDPRLAWINERVVACLKVKADRFTKMCTSETECVAIKDFLDNQDTSRVFFVDGAKEMYCYAIPPAATKKKVMFMLKPWGEGQARALTKDNIDQLVIGDVSPKLMENMFGVFQDVYLPILSNTKNQEVRAAPDRPAPDRAHRG